MKRELAVSKPEVLRLLEREKEKAIEQEVMAAVKKAQEMHSDFLGLGDRFYRKYPHVWPQIKDEWNGKWFPHVEVEVEVKCKIRRMGTTVDPVPYKTHRR